jgi:hypothetical protein
MIKRSSVEAAASGVESVGAPNRDFERSPIIKLMARKQIFIGKIPSRIFQSNQVSYQSGAVSSVLVRRAQSTRQAF